MWAGIVEGLSFCHRHEIVHCDLKPHNVLLDKSLVAVLCDFGMTRGATNATHSRTVVAGTELYMDPERLQHEQVVRTAEARMDIYSAGYLLWELLTGTMLQDAARQWCAKEIAEALAKTPMESAADRVRFEAEFSIRTE